uniref:Bromo domain-containing protein n=1 Tax=Plectus sambesii TaxID=2011161 RepID=A0A914X3I8_9BILA
MDLRTMLNKLKNHQYDSPTEIRDDARLMFTNCRTYNEDGSDIFECATRLEAFMEERFAHAFGENGRKRRTL